MIKLQDVMIRDLLPQVLRGGPEVDALSYAIHKAIGLVLAYSDRSMVYSAIDQLPEPVLDALAVEWRAQYYDATLGIDVKRQIIRGTMPLFSRLGTTKAVEDMINIVLGTGEVVEWYDMVPPGPPYTFDILTTATLSGDIAESFKKMIKKVKNTRSHLRNVRLGIRMEGSQSVGGAMLMASVISIK